MDAEVSEGAVARGCLNFYMVLRESYWKLSNLEYDNLGVSECHLSPN